MHIVLGVLTSIVTVLYLLDRIGVDIGGLNPWSWRRRRAWRNKFEGDPIYAVENPVDVAAIFVVGGARLGGDLSANQKTAAMLEFEQRFSLDARAAAELYGSASHLLGGPQLVATQLGALVDRHRNTFSSEQAESLIGMIETVAGADGDLSDEQQQFIDAVRANIAKPQPPRETWA